MTSLTPWAARLRTSVEHIGQRPADFLAARVGDDAEAAVAAAAFHDRDEGGGAFGARRRQFIEFLDRRKTHIHDAAAGAAQLRNHFRQAMQGLRAEHQVHARRALHDGAGLLARDAAAHADDDMRPRGLERAPFAQQRIHLVLGFLAHRAGVHDENVGLGRGVGGNQAGTAVQDIRHARGVVLVHLATERLDEIAAGHTWENREDSGDFTRLARSRRGETAAATRDFGGRLYFTLKLPYISEYRFL